MIVNTCNIKTDYKKHKIKNQFLINKVKFPMLVNFRVIIFLFC